MKKNKHSKQNFLLNSAYYASLFAMFTLGMVFEKQVLSEKSQTPHAKPDIPAVNINDTTTLPPVSIKSDTNVVMDKPTVVFNKPIDNAKICTQNKIDSLTRINARLFDSVADKYAARIENSYKLGLFFNKQEIDSLNNIIREGIIKDIDSIVADDAYEYVKSNMPMTSNTPIVTLEDLAYYSSADSTRLARIGIIFQDGQICGFTNNKRQKLFQQYVKEYSAASLDSGSPNFNIPEIADIQPEYAMNLCQIAILNRQLSANDTITKQRGSK